MRQLILILAISFLGSSQIFAQEQAGKIRGMVQGGSGNPTISLRMAGDSSLVKMGLPDKSGAFVFDKLAPGNYLVHVSAVGYADVYSAPVFLLKNETLQVSAIELVPVSKALQGVTVSSKRPLVEHKIDRMVVNVDASLTNVGATAMEVLEKSPGISVDRDGNISLKGKEGVIVLVDGRPTQLSSVDLANLLKGMQASQLDQVEIMTNPPARFDAAGNAGVINIKTKKSKQMGYNGSFTAGFSQGRLPKINEGFNFNYRKNKFNLFTNLSHSYRESSNNLDIQRNFRDNSTKEIITYFDQQGRMLNRFHSYNAKLGVDYFLSNKTTLGVVLNGFTNPGTWTNDNISMIYQPPTNLISQTLASIRSDRSWDNLGGNINFRQVLDSAGTELTADLDHSWYSNSNTQLMVNSYYDAHGNATEKADSLAGNLPQTISIYSGRVDFIRPLKKDGRFEAGIKSSYVQTDANAMYDSISFGQVIPDRGRSNHFLYEERIHAAYVNASVTLSKKINAQFGLRTEHTDAKGNQLTTGEKFRRKYTQLFPTAYIQYKINENNNLGMNYGRRIRRPDYQSLNPFINFLDRYTFQQGNPDLRPQFSHNIELTHSFKNIITTTLNYNVTTDIINQVIEQNEQTNETFVKRGNIAKRNQWGISSNISTSFAKWHSGNVYLNYFWNHFEGIIGDTAISLDGGTFMVQAMQQFNLGRGWSAEVGGNYHSKILEGVFTIQGQGALNAGFSKQVLKDKGSIRFNVRDILYTRIGKGTSRYGNVDVRFREAGDSRVANLSFNYRFGKGKVNGVKRRAGSATDEQNRVGAGGN